jgi:hypothetical protein
VPGWPSIEYNNKLPLTYIIVSSAEARTGPRPESSGNADSQRTPRIAAAAAGGSAPAPGDGGRPVDNPTDDRAMVPYQAEAGNAR